MHYLQLYIVLLFSDLQAVKSECANWLQPLEMQADWLCKTSSRTTGERGKAGIKTQQRCRMAWQFRVRDSQNRAGSAMPRDTGES